MTFMMLEENSSFVYWMREDKLISDWTSVDSGDISGGLAGQCIPTSLDMMETLVDLRQKLSLAEMPSNTSSGTERYVRCR